MIPGAASTEGPTAWHGPGAPRLPGTSLWQRVRHSWKFGRRERSRVTLPGALLVLLTLAIGTAAYNASNNLLFLALSLLLASLILSGVLSTLNFLGCAWRIVPSPPMRVNEPSVARIQLRNGQRLLPIQGLFFDLVTPGASKPLRAFQRVRLDPGSTLDVACPCTPTTRGLHRIRLLYIGSFFPFGFLRKGLLGHCDADVIVRPARIPYTLVSTNLLRIAPGRRTLPRPGRSGDLLALRPYRPGDPHREIHWKASARTGRLVVRSFSTEASERIVLRIDTHARPWADPHRFETLCSFASSLAEDLFAAGRLESAVIDGKLQPMHTARDLEACLDRLSLLTPAPAAAAPTTVVAFRARPELTFNPGPGPEIHAHLDGQLVATA